MASRAAIRLLGVGKRPICCGVLRYPSSMGPHSPSWFVVTYLSLAGLPRNANRVTALVCVYGRYKARLVCLSP